MKKMKNIILAAITMFIFSCEKRCYECTQTITASSIGISPQVTTNEFEHCGSVRNVEGRKESISTVSGVTVKVVSKTVCD